MVGVADAVAATLDYLRPYFGTDIFTTKATERGATMHRLIRSSTLSEGEGVVALARWHTIPWPEHIMVDLVRAVHASTSLLATLKPNNATQDYIAITNYYTAAHWQVWPNNTRGDEHTQGSEDIVAVASSLRLTKPSEGTSQTLAAMASLATYDLGVAEASPPSD